MADENGALMINSTAMKLIAGGLCAVALQGCAIFSGGSDRVAATPAAETSNFEMSGRYAASAGPTGLVRCKKANVNAQDCWRRGDAHILYPDASPGGVDATSAAYATPTPVRASKKK